MRCWPFSQFRSQDLSDVSGAIRPHGVLILFLFFYIWWISSQKGEQGQYSWLQAGGLMGVTGFVVSLR